MLTAGRSRRTVACRTHIVKTGKTEDAGEGVPVALFEQIRGETKSETAIEAKRFEPSEGRRFLEYKEMAG